MGAAQDRVTAELVDRLPERGNVRVDVVDLQVSVESWRRAARTAGRRLGRPVRTLRHDGGVVAFLGDWPATAEERERQQRYLRAAVNSLSNPTRPLPAPAVDEPPESAALS